MVGSINSFLFIVILFFVFLGIIMNNGGIVKKLVDFVMLFVGCVLGVLVYMNVLGNVLFGFIFSLVIVVFIVIGGVLIF